MLITLDEGIAEGSVRVEEIGGEAFAQERINQIAPPDEAAEDRIQQQTAQEPLDQSAAGDSEEVQQIQMRGSGAQVNTLQVINESEQYLFISAGEIIKGGKQNRVVSRDVIIPPGEASGALDVFCVEQGRWIAYEESGTSFASAKELVAQNSLKKTILSDAGQTAVWEKVSELNAAQDAATETDNYLAGLEEGIDSEAAAAYVSFLLPKLSDGRTAGIIAAVNGEIQGADLFFDPLLCAAHGEKIIRSYAYDALIEAHSRTADRQKAEAFLSSVFSAEKHGAAETDHYLYLTIDGGGVLGGYLQFKSDSGILDVHAAAVPVGGNGE
jgi:hypothetical protein